MECTGKLINISRDWQSNKLNITLSINENINSEIEKIKDVEKLSIKVNKYRKREA